MRFEDLTQLSIFLEVLNRIITSAMIYGGANKDSHMASDKDLLINLKYLRNSLNNDNEKLLNDNMKIVIIVDDGYYQLGVEKII